MTKYVIGIREGDHIAIECYTAGSRVFPTEHAADDINRECVSRILQHGVNNVLVFTLVTIDVSMECDVTAKHEDTEDIKRGMKL